jgi:hypothetical protein
MRQLLNPGGKAGKLRRRLERERWKKTGTKVKDRNTREVTRLPLNRFFGLVYFSELGDQSRGTNEPSPSKKAKLGRGKGQNVYE